jgi:hypothetical protein
MSVVRVLIVRQYNRGGTQDIVTARIAFRNSQSNFLFSTLQSVLIRVWHSVTH